MTRIIAGLAAAALLGGCNAVSTPAPLLPADSGVLRPGVWRADMEKDCAFDDSLPIAQWPSCAAAPIVHADGVGRMVGEGEGAHGFDLRLVRGEPLIVEATATPAKGEEAGFKPLTIYLAGRATSLDAKGRTTAAELWLVQCGPPAGGGEITQHPLPGLTVDPQAKTCAPGQPQDLRNAAAASEAWADPDDLLKIRWLRDGGA